MGREIAIVLVATAVALAPAPAAAEPHHQGAGYRPPLEFAMPANPLTPPPATNPGHVVAWSDPRPSDQRLPAGGR